MKIAPSVLILLSGAIATLTTAAGTVSICNAGFKQTLRLPDYSDVSGITWKGLSNFYVVRDGGNSVTNACCIHEMLLSLDKDGCMYSAPRMTRGVNLAGARDAEGIAYDPCSGNVWISDESGSRIREYDPETGIPTGRFVPVPSFVVKGARTNLSLESLTISGDGLALWTANEEALVHDGAPAKPKMSTVVRLMRFLRRNVASDWEPAGMWAYSCDPVGKREPMYSGVSDLCALPDDSLLVLERECSYTTLGRTRIYRPDFTHATDVSNFASLTNSKFTAVAKGAPLYETMDGKWSGDGFLKSQVACYEGLCLGPRNEDGSVNLMLVSDGGVSLSKKKLFITASVETKPFVRSLKLTGLDVCTLAFESPDFGYSDRIGSCYRYLRGATVSVEYDPTVPVDIHTDWTLPAHGLSGSGTNATFVVACDDCFHWLSPESLAARRRIKDLTSHDRAFDIATVERSWRLGMGGFGRGGIRRRMSGFRSDHMSVFGAEMDLQYSLVQRGSYDLSLVLGGTYCPTQGDGLDRTTALGSSGQMELGYGEVRCLAVTQRRLMDDFSLGLRFGVAFDWLNATSSIDGGMEDFSDSDTEFAAQGIFGVQATWQFMDRLGLYSTFDWRLGDQTEFETRGVESTIDMSGWTWGVGMSLTF